ncbi:MAG: O-antigen ligase family protein [Pseudomonadota bacterium]
MTHKIILFLAFCLPGVGMLSGLAAAPMIGIMVFLLLFKYRSEVLWRNLLTALLHRKAKPLHRGILLLLSFAFLSCFWSPRVLQSLWLWFQVSCLILMLLLLTPIPNILQEIMPPMIAGMIFAIILFYIEYFTGGMITSGFREIFQNGRGEFALSKLDRGCSILSVYTWVVIWYLWTRSKPFAALLYTIVFITLSLSDSTAGFVAFILASVTFVVLYITNMRIAHLVTIGLISGIILMPIFAYKQDPLELSNNHLGQLISWQHRLFIWDFVAHKAAEKPILGHGFDASRYLGENQSIDYKHYHLPLLPLHPHNNILQMWLELGCVGLILFAFTIYGVVAEIKKNYFGASGPLALACFVNYFVIGMISFGVWQMWWVLAGSFAAYMAANLRYHRPL